ncbi:MAG: alpha/beta fold hydrolase [Bacteroidia bacterium]
MNLFYRHAGNTTAKPLIILHGLFGISDNWAALARRWSEHFSVYSVDLRNHGQSGQSEDWNYQAMADDVLELFGEQSLHNAVLLGHSMGGKTAMRFALDYPLALSKLIVCDIAPRAYAPQQREVVDALLAVKPEELSSRKEAEERLARGISDVGTLQFLLKNLYWKENENGEKKLAWRFNLPVIDQKLDAVSEPTDTPAPCLVDTLFIRGERSNYITEADEQNIPKIFPNSQFLTVANAGHWVHADQPDAVFEAVMKFAE